MTSSTQLPGMRESLFDVGGKPIFVSEAGDPDATPVLLLHGGGPGASGVSNCTRNIGDGTGHLRRAVADARLRVRDG